MKQIFPPSITGKGATGTVGAEVSVLDHAFGKSDPYTLGALGGGARLADTLRWVYPREGETR